jgi:hypothetical protein
MRSGVGLVAASPTTQTASELHALDASLFEHAGTAHTAANNNQVPPSLDQLAPCLVLMRRTVTQAAVKYHRKPKPIPNAFGAVDLEGHPGSHVSKTSS